MFTGIIETLGKVVDIKLLNSNIDYVVSSPVSKHLKIDQSVSHNGVCLTVVDVNNAGWHRVTAIEETLRKTNLSLLHVGDEINIERCLAANGRFDGHLVQGHVDQTGACIGVEAQNGSWIYTFKYNPSEQNIVVEKGSICVNGISLTAFSTANDVFSVAIIPYTHEHTNIKQVKVGSLVNLEFDIVGKYIARILDLRGR